MSTRMVHDLHGVTHAVGAEVDWNKANGWRVEENPPVKPVPEEKAAVIANDPVVEIATPEGRYEAKFGKKPHWKMKPETIEAALKD